MSGSLSSGIFSHNVTYCVCLHSLPGSHHVTLLKFGLGKQTQENGDTLATAIAESDNLAFVSDLGVSYILPVSTKSVTG